MNRCPGRSSPISSTACSSRRPRTEMPRTRLRLLLRWMSEVLHLRPADPPATFQPAPTFVPAGHYYSPLPAAEDIERLERCPASAEPLPGIQLDPEAQLALLEQLAQFYSTMPFTAEQSPGLRYRFDN